MQNGYSREKLAALGIFQLREVARSVGVHLPTTYKKDELIKKIMQVVNGEVEPFVPKTKKGRPPKSLIGFEGVWQKQEKLERKVTANSSWLQGRFLENEQPSFMFGVSMPECEFNSGLPKQEISGLVFCEPNGRGTLHIGGISKILKNKTAIIPARIIDEFNLQTGDSITGTSLKDDELIVTNITSVNGVLVSEIRRINFEDLITTSSSKIIPLWSNEVLNFTKFITPIGKGQRVFVGGDKTFKKDEILKAFAEEFDKNKIHTIFIALDKRPEEHLNLPSDVDYGFSSFDMVPFRQMYLIELAVAQAKRMCEMGKDVALIIDDLISVMKAYEYSTQKNNSEAEINIMIEIKKLLAVGRNTENGGSITLVATMCDAKTEKDKKYSEMFDKLCNTHIYLSRKLENLDSKYCVTPQSVTDNAYQLLDKGNLKLMQKFQERTEEKSINDAAEIYNEF